MSEQEGQTRGLFARTSPPTSLPRTSSSATTLTLNPGDPWFFISLFFSFMMTMDPIPHRAESSPQPRQSILPNFLRSRPRNLSLSVTQHDSNHDSPPLALAPIPDDRSTPPPGPTGHRRRPAAANPTTPPVIQLSYSQSALSQMLRRRRSAGALANHQPNPQTPPLQPPATLSATNNPSSRPSHRIRLVPHLDSRRSLRFDPIARDVKEGDAPLRIGRFTDRSGLGIANAPGSNKLAFKSKVVSRAHAEIWAEGGKFLIRDTKSSSGTFLNHVRLSPANAESRPFELKDGDVLQLGVDYQGGTEDIYKCVKIKVEVNREWQATPNAFKFVPSSYPSCTFP